MKFDQRAVFEFGLNNDSNAKIQVYKRTVKDGDELVEYSVPKISGEKGQLHCILEQWPDFRRSGSPSSLGTSALTSKRRKAVPLTRPEKR